MYSNDIKLVTTLVKDRQRELQRVAGNSRLRREAVRARQRRWQ